MSKYNPNPTRVWSRVQNPCTYDNSYDYQYSVYIPLTGQTVSQSQANYEKQMINKGNVLQYKSNSARLTKSQKYAQLARCAGPNRTKVFATQSQTYTNPNTTWLLRVNYTTYEFPNQIPGAPNNISGPFQYNQDNPNDCSGNSIQDGGSLICGTYVDPCTDQIIKQEKSSMFIYNSASASNVPGTDILYWSNKVQTWFPRNRYIMNNSTDKWPINYKYFNSAIELLKPLLVLDVQSNDDTVELNWSIIQSNCYPVTKIDISIDGKLYKSVSNNISSLKINKSEFTNTCNTCDDENEISFLRDSLISVQYYSNKIASSIGNIKYTPDIDSTSCSCSLFDKIMNNNCISDVNSYLTNYNNTLLDLNSTDYNFLLNSYTELKLELEVFKQCLDQHSCLTKIVDIYQKILTQLYQSSTIKNLLFNQTKLTSQYKDAYDILNNPEKLSEYLQGLNKDFKIIQFETKSELANLKPQYSIYFQKYGIPDNLNFDSEKLLDVTESIKDYIDLYGVPEDSNYNLNIINNLIFLRNNPTLMDLLLEKDDYTIKNLLMNEDTSSLEEILLLSNTLETNTLETNTLETNTLERNTLERNKFYGFPFRK
jgi:hypothetical protein